MESYNGFIWIETLISLHIVLVLMTTAVPIYTSIQKEKEVLKDRSIYSLYLFNELQEVLHDESGAFNQRYEQVIDKRNIVFNFKMEGEYVKGCATWENAKKKSETRCLYGLHA